ncbi:virulence RhuM family protein [Candidatus Symbiothrix dinenymphae]|uniref:virulence RhuM family protein n=1 Tax=Candidatus Symbiothrix dinenymphae TaxID=467085 RepID=UPI000702F9B1|nr:RhuM family protein [Candidatus Symbiothrix dinenymphae]
MSNKDEIVFYQPDNFTRLDVRVEEDTVWLTQAQMVALFERHVSVISRHIKKIFEEGELDEKSNLHFLQIANSDKPIAFYSLDVIISVGYRVKSQRGTEFRIWAIKTLRDCILRGYAVNPRIENLEYRVTETEKQIAFFVQKSLPPLEGIFYDGQVFDAYIFAAELVKSAKKSIILIDNYVDESVLLLLSKRDEQVSATIYTPQISAQFKLDLQKHQTQYPEISVKIFTHAHDRFLIIDDDVYHIGASVKDLGKKMFAFTKMGFTAGAILSGTCF